MSMMEFRTPVHIPTPPFAFTYTDRTMLIGSCFAENIGKRMQENKFEVDINPFGILFNPASMAKAIRRLLNPVLFTKDDLFEHEGVYHSWMHHSRFSSVTPGEALQQMNDRLVYSAEQLRRSTRLIITFGTAYSYILRSKGHIVANCHKLPEQMFRRERLNDSTIFGEWKGVLKELWVEFPALKVLFTVSPIRHWKDGANANQLSKAMLLLTIERLRKLFPNQVEYFPAYEIMMDELRDYRFYCDDMLHPSTLAVDYIWQRFCEHNLSIDSREIYREWQEIRRALDHRPFRPDSEAYKQFVRQTLLKIELLHEKIPSFDLSNEYTFLVAKL